MSMRRTLQASARIIVGLALVASLVPFASSDAEARRRGGGGGGGGGHTISVPSVRSDSGSSTLQSSRTEASSGGATLKASVATPVKPVAKIEDRDVPGCAVGKICTVCVAGCYDSNNSIIHAAPKDRKP